MRPTVHSAVLPAVTPERATDFFGLGRARPRSCRAAHDRCFASAKQLVELLLVVVIAEHFVQLGARLHQVRPHSSACRRVRIALYTASAAWLIARNADSGYSTKRTPAAPSSATVNSGVLPNSVMLASTGTRDRVGELAVFVQRRQRFGEDHVGAGLDIGRGALDRRRLALHRVRVGARHDDESLSRAPIDGGLDAIDHLVRAAPAPCPGDGRTLGLHLVFEVHTARARTMSSAHRARDVEGTAPAGIGIDQQRQVAWRA